MARSRSSAAPATIPPGEREDVAGKEEAQGHRDTPRTSIGRSSVAAGLCQGGSHVVELIQVGGGGGASPVPISCGSVGLGHPVSRTAAT